MATALANVRLPPLWIDRHLLTLQAYILAEYNPLIYSCLLISLLVMVANQVLHPQFK